MINEFVIVSVLMQTKNHYTLTRGLFRFIDQQYSEHRVEADLAFAAHSIR